MNIHFNQEVPAYSEEKMLEAIDAAKKEYRRQMMLKPMSGWEFLFQQMLSLSKRYWLVQLVVFGVAAISLGFLNLYTGMSDNKIIYCTIYAPMLIIFSIPELWKNISTKAYEVENTTYFDLRKLYLSRIVLVGMFDLIIATALTAITVKYSGFSPYEAIIYFFVPFNLNSCICFTLLSIGRICSELLAVGGCISGALIWYMLVTNYQVYELLQVKTWYILLALSFVYLIFAGKRFVESGKSYLEVCE